MLDNRACGAQQPHSLFAEEAFRVVFHSRIDFVIAIASPNAERRTQPAQLGDAGVERIAFAADEVSRHKRNVRLQVVSHGNSARDFVRRHVVANVDVAELSDAQAVELRRKIGDGHINALDGVTQAPSGKSIGRCEEWKTSSKNGGVLKEGPARGTEPTRNRSGAKPGSSIGEPLDRSHGFDRQESEE